MVACDWWQPGIVAITGHVSGSIVLWSLVPYDRTTGFALDVKILDGIIIAPYFQYLYPLISGPCARQMIEKLAVDFTGDAMVASPVTKEALTAMILQYINCYLNQGRSNIIIPILRLFCPILSVVLLHQRSPFSKHRDALEGAGVQPNVAVIPHSACGRE